MTAAFWLLLALQSGSDEAFFEKKIRPLLAERCASCHSAAANKRKGGLLLDSRDAVLRGGDTGPAAVPGKPEESLLLKAVRYSSEDLKMPPKGKLPTAAADDLAEWIRRGLPWPADGAVAKQSASADASRPLPWSFRPIRKPAIPPVGNSAWPANDVDRFVLARLEEGGFTPAPPADRAALLRRVTFDLIGLPPTVEELNAFLADDSPEAFAKVVERLLASPHFGERWGRYWMDVARYADSVGCGGDYTLDEAWRYRDYIIDAFNADKPYDDFVREQIAGDLLPKPVLVATGFLLVGPKELAEYDKEKLRMDVVDEQLNAIGQAFLGLTFGCARCHDHKFAPIATADYYSLAGILRSTRTITGNISGPLSGWNRRLLEPTPDRSKALAEWKARVERCRVRYVEVRDRRNAAAEAQAMERSLAALKEEGRTDEAELRRFQAEIDKKKKVVAFPPEEIARREKEWIDAYLQSKPDEALAVEDEKTPADLRIHIRGDARNLGAPAPRGFVRSIPLPGADAVPAGASGRLQLAAWITHPDHPLTARVWVNRIWQHLLGVGLVRTPDNFGARGEAPSHPELLDYLAVRLREEKGSLKSLVRLIVLSRTYQMASRGGATDRENRLLGRRDLRRLDAEALRDAMLAQSGELDRTRGGSTMTYAGRLFIQYESTVLPVDPWRRRAVYLPIYRGTTPPDLLEVFDFPPTGLVTGRRASTTVATQALFMMNSPFVLDRARAAARSLLGRTDLDDGGRIDLLYRTTFGRLATAPQRERARRFLAGGGEAAWTDLVQTLWASNEFLFLE